MPEIDAVIALERDSEGWLPLAPSPSLGHIVKIFPWDQPFYVIRFEVPIEVQEPDDRTPSTLRLYYYQHAVINARWVGTQLEANASVQVYVRLVPSGEALPTSLEGCAKLPVRAWATCRVISYA